MTRRQFPVGRVGGFMAPLPEAARAEIARRWATIPLDRIGAAFGWYGLQRQAAAAQPEPKEIEQRYARLQESVAELRGEVSWLKSTNLAMLIDYAAAGRVEDWHGLGELDRSLMILSALLGKVRPMLPAGAQANPRQSLALEVGRIVGAAGLPVDATPNGPLCQIVGIVLQAASEEPSNVAMIVRPMLKFLKKTAV